jgi:hypothetical protein
MKVGMMTAIATNHGLIVRGTVNVTGAGIATDDVEFISQS